MLQLQDLTITPSLVKVRTFTDITISFHLNQHLPKDSSLILRLRGGRNNKNDWYYLQPYDPKLKGYINTNIYQLCSVLPILITGKDLLIKYKILGDRGIPANESLTFELKQTLVQSIVEENKKIDILVEIPGKDPLNLQQNKSIRVVNEIMDHFTIICPSTINIKEDFEALIRAEDRFYNLVNDFSGKIELFRTNEKAESKSIGHYEFDKVNEGILRINGIHFSIPGINYIELEFEAVRYRSNPILIKESSFQKRLFWGYIHGHTNKSDGLRDIEKYYKNMLNAGLNFGTTTEHDHKRETTDKDFKEVREIVQKFNQNGHFITIFGYEWGYWYTPGYGDICIYHKNDSIPILRSDTNKFNSTEKLIKNMLPEESMVLMIGHHTALRPGYRNWDYFDNRLEKLVEIYSTWGNQEFPFKEGNPLPPRYKFFGYGPYAKKRGPILEKVGSFVQDALKRGYKLGFTAGGDDHYGIYPSGPLDPDDGIYPSGIMAIWADDLSRDSIWRALNQRSCYGTTGPRVILKFAINDFSMGNVIDLSDSDKLKNIRNIKVKIFSPIHILKLEIIRNNQVFKQEKINTKIVKKEYQDDDNFDKFALITSQKERFIFYYLRITLQNNNMAWSSPIWISLK